MMLESLVLVLQEGLERLLEKPPPLIFLLAISALWVFWRIWKFTVLPVIRPNEPREVPYCTPYIGSALAFFRDSHAVMTDGRKRSKAREPFAVTIMGEKFYILKNPDDVVEAYKNTTALSFDLFVRELMLSCGGTFSSVATMCQEPPAYLSESLLSTNPKKKSLARLAVDFHHTQLLPGPDSELDQLGVILTKYIDESLHWDKMSRTSSCILKASPDEIEVSLLHWCGDILIEAGTSAYFGKALVGLEPGLLQAFYDLDNEMWKILFRYPRIFSRGVHAAKDKIANALTRYYKLPQSQRPGETWFVRTLEAEQRQVGLNEEEMAVLVMIVYFTINTNTYKLCFWLLSHILTSPTLLASIRSEIAPAFSTSVISIPHLTNHCPHLDAALSEVLRLYSNSASVRYILDDVVIGSKTLYKYNKIMVPFRQLHENEDVYGANVLEFEPERFLKNKNLKRSPSFRPFGGGTTYCPGRFIAKQEAVAFVATALWRFDLELVKGKDGAQQPFPRLESGKPCFGMMGPINRDDLVVRVKRVKS